MAENNQIGDSKKGNLAVVLVGAVVLLALVGYVLARRSSNQEAITNTQGPTASPTPSQNTATPTVTPTKTPTSQEVIIKYTDNGYSPSTVTVAQGTKVTFVNESSGLMWTASANHPTHEILPAFDAKAGVAIGSKYSFTFTSPGTWRFHNHLKPSFFGSVVVQ